MDTPPRLETQDILPGLLCQEDTGTEYFRSKAVEVSKSVEPGLGPAGHLPMADPENPRGNLVTVPQTELGECL